MLETRIIKRYNAYYQGWCLAFGEHSADYEEQRDINWLFGADRMGLILSKALRKQAQREFLGKQRSLPELVLSQERVRMNRFTHPLQAPAEHTYVQRLIDFLLDSAELHMFLCSHLIYPSHTRIITFARKKPLIIMYKEMQPLQLRVE